MLLGFSRSTVCRVYQEWSTTQRTSSQLDRTVGSIRVNMGQHPCGTLSTPRRVHALFLEQKGVQLNIRKVFLMFCALNVCLALVCLLNHRNLDPYNITVRGEVPCIIKLLMLFYGCRWFRAGGSELCLGQCNVSTGVECTGAC